MAPTFIGAILSLLARWSWAPAGCAGMGWGLVLSHWLLVAALLRTVGALRTVLLLRTILGLLLRMILRLRLWAERLELRLRMRLLKLRLWVRLLELRRRPVQRLGMIAGLAVGCNVRLE